MGERNWAVDTLSCVLAINSCSEVEGGATLVWGKTGMSTKRVSHGGLAEGKRRRSTFGWCRQSSIAWAGIPKRVCGSGFHVQRDGRDHLQGECTLARSSLVEGFSRGRRWCKRFEGFQNWSVGLGGEEPCSERCSMRS